MFEKVLINLIHIFPRKKGVSAVIATVLLILITVAAVTIIWAFVIPMINDSLSGVNELVNIQIIQEGYTAWDPVNYLAEVQVQRGTDEAEIAGFDLIFSFGGNAVKHFVDGDLPNNNKKVVYINFSNYSNSGNLDSIKLIPVFEKGKRGSVTSVLYIDTIPKQELKDLPVVFESPNSGGPVNNVGACTNAQGCTSTSSVGCNSNIPFTCSLGSDGCLDKILGSDCGALICNATTGTCQSIISPACTNDVGCASVSSVGCNANIPFTCSLGGDGCLDKNLGSDCGALICNSTTGVCQTTTVPPGCGDTTCNGVETCSTCPSDCGCVTGQTCINGVCSPNQNNNQYVFTDANCTYYVDNVVSNCQTYNPVTRSCTGGAKRVYNNFRTGFTSATAGNTVCFRGGDYALNDEELLIITPQGVENNRIIFANYNKENVIFRGGHNVSSLYAYDFRNSRYFDLIGLTFLGYLEKSNNQRYYANDFVIFGYVGGVQNMNVINCTFLANWGTDDILGRMGRGTPVRVVGGTDVVFDKVNSSCVDSLSRVMASTGPYPIGPSGDAIVFDYSSGVIIKNSFFGDCGHDSIHLRNSDNFIIENNVISNRLHNGIDFNWGGNSVVRNNIIYNLNLNPTEQPGEAIEILYSSNNKIYNNIIYNGDYDAKGINPQGSSTEGYADNNEIFNNLIYNFGRSGVGLPKLEVTRNNKIYNNIIYGIKTNPIHNHYGEVIMSFSSIVSSLPTNYYGTDIRNNIIRSFNTNNKAIRIKGYASTPVFDFTAEEFNNQFSWAENNIGSDPLFVSIPNYDFHLTANSPAIDSGICIDYITTDFDGNSRPHGAGCDIGPYEYQG
jgi:flagellin-like protein